MHGLHSYLFPFLWSAWALYWYATSFTANPPKRVQSALRRRLHVAELLVAFALLSYPQVGYGPLGLRVLPASWPLFPSGAVMLVCGLGITVWARVCLGPNWSGHVTLKEGHKLIRRGPYAFVRHPIYTGLLVAMLGTAVAIGEVRGFVGVLIAAQAFVRKLRLEERWLTEEFGAEYDRYRAEVKALLPGVF